MTISELHGPEVGLGHVSITALTATALSTQQCETGSVTAVLSTTFTEIVRSNK